MKQYTYIIIGGGLTAHAAIKGIHSVNTKAAIAVISNESYKPYNRPPLSKALWKGDPVDSIWLSDEPKSVEYFLSRTVTEINTREKQVTDSLGDVFTYNKLLLATGGRVRTLTSSTDEIIYFRTFDDYKMLKEQAEKTDQPVLVIGGGFIGSEIAAALAMNGKKVRMIFPETGIGSRVYPSGLSKFLNKYYKSKGVEVNADEGIESVKKNDSGYIAMTSKDREIKAGVIVAGLGLLPNSDLAQSAGLEVDNGIKVNEYLQTSDPDIFAAGDVANFFNQALGKRMRLEHEDNAITMGEIAGKNMTGSKEPYNHLPFFYSDLFELGYEAVGELDSRLETVEEWQDEFKEGVIYYLKDNVIRGVLLWNVWDRLDDARKLIINKSAYKKGLI